VSNLYESKNQGIVCANVDRGLT